MRATDETTNILPDALSKIEIPPWTPPTPEQLEQWHKLAEEAGAIRAEIGPIDIRTDELVHMGRVEAGIEE
jgi:hypothetical protein